jgi:beta-ribofuranosylaminobenzene 5'-phosphate synthase
MSATILISTGARLHFGFFAHDGARSFSGETNYGGVGLMIDAPSFVLAASGHDPEARARPSGTPGRLKIESGLDEVRCNMKRATQSGAGDPFAGPPVDKWSELGARALRFIREYRTRASRGNRPPLHCEMELWSAIPAHQGLGSGTQLGMAVATALAMLAEEPDIDPVTLARRVGRGARSAIGIHGFGQGGFLVDAGKEREELIGRLEARVSVPADWRFLLVNPPGRAAGLSGKAESEALGRLPATSREMTDRLRRLALEEMLPALKSTDCDRFADAIFEFGRINGDYFQPVQGGTYSTSEACALVEWIRGHGRRGIAQTSWGPTLAICCPDQSAAETLRDQLHAEPRWQQCPTRIARPLNAGARVQSISSPESG